MTFELYIPEELTFQDYIEVCQVVRTLADGYDRKDRHRLASIFCSTVSIDYSLVHAPFGVRNIPSSTFISDWLSPSHLGKRVLATQHLLGIPYFKSVSDTEIEVEYQQLASHARRVGGEDWKSPACKVREESDGRSWMGVLLLREREDERKEEGGLKERQGKSRGRWRIKRIRPEVIYHTGDFRGVDRPQEEDERDGGVEAESGDGKHGQKVEGEK